MPGGDGTGPLGFGSRTGRGMGNCPPNTNSNIPMFPKFDYGRGFGGRGFGRGFGRRFWLNQQNNQEKKSEE